jgi:tRNA (guanine37-N1)-methyltransferase
MKYTILSLFPEIIDAFFATSIMAKAVDRGLVDYRLINIRDYAQDKHHSCDDAPYGGGAGMLMLPEPLGWALEAAGACPQVSAVPLGAGVPAGASAVSKAGKPWVVYLSPSGRPFTQDVAKELAHRDELILLCGRYEGVDQRIVDAYVDEELSIGDYVLSSGEAAALVVIDATYRLLDDVITAESLDEESFSGGLLEYPQYTRPENYAIVTDTSDAGSVKDDATEMTVPEVLLSGHHEHIRRWRLRKRVEKTLAVRPDLIRRGLESGLFDDETVKIIEELQGVYHE